ncbi:MAG: hypothetical protein ACTSWN_08390 [Promethearchaeota archaeon]
MTIKDIEFLIDGLIDREKLKERDIIFFNKEIVVPINKADNAGIEIGRVYTMYGAEIEGRLQAFLQPEARAINLAKTSRKT